MYKKTVSFVDPMTGTQAQKTLHFHLTRAEIIKMDMQVGGNLRQYLSDVKDSNDPARIIGAFEDIIAAAYGDRTPSGEFVKSDEIRQSFMSSEAYSAFLMDLLSNPETAVPFIRQLLPQGENSEQDAKLDAIAEEAAAELTPSQIARANSEARMQGHKPSKEFIKQQEEREKGRELQRELEEKGGPQLPEGLTPEAYQQFLAFQAFQASQSAQH